MPEVKESKVGDATVFFDANPNSPIMGQELFRFTAPPETAELKQQVVDNTLYNINPKTGVAAEAIVGDPRENLTSAVRAPTFASTGVTSPYAVGGGARQPPMMAPATPTAPAAQAVGTPTGGQRGAPGVGGDVFGRMIRQESRGNQFNRSGKPLTSSAGAIGIAQVMPKTAPEAAKLAGLPFDDNRYRNDAEYNLALGKAYYEKQLRDFGDERLAAAAYNAGPGAVRSALKKGGPNGWINHVPLETRKYVKAVFGGGGGTPPSAGAAATPTSTDTGQPITLGEQQRRKGFRTALELFDYDPKTGADSVSPLIKASTSGGAEKLGSDIAGFFGVGTSGAVARGQLETLRDNMTFEKLRGKLGAQISDADVRLIASTMGDISNPNTPASVRLAKWQNIVLPILVRGAGMTYVKPKAASSGSGSGSGTKVIKTLTPEQVRAAPSGTVYRTTDGRRLTKP
jgi:soluble lytic murein transglycosylase-like protein